VLSERAGDDPWLAFEHINAYQRNSPAECLAILSRFCAQYLPKLVDSIHPDAHIPVVDRSNPALADPEVVQVGINFQKRAYHDLEERMAALHLILRFCRPYMDKYLFVSVHGNRGLHLGACALKAFEHNVVRSRTMLGGSLVPASQLPSGQQAAMVYTVLDKMLLKSSFFSTLLIHLPEETRRATLATPSNVIRELVEMGQAFHGWTALFPNIRPRLDDLNAALSGRIVPNTDDLDEVHGLERCGRRGCTKTTENAQLFKCSRCEVVLYCSKRHQIEDREDSTRPHKAWCYKTWW